MRSLVFESFYTPNLLCSLKMFSYLDSLECESKLYPLIQINGSYCMRRVQLNLISTIEFLRKSLELSDFLAYHILPGVIFPPSNLVTSLSDSP